MALDVYRAVKHRRLNDQALKSTSLTSRIALSPVIVFMPVLTHPFFLFVRTVEGSLNAREANILIAIESQATSVTLIILTEESQNKVWDMIPINFEVSLSIAIECSIRSANRAFYGTALPSRFLYADARRSTSYGDG